VVDERVLTPDLMYRASVVVALVVVAFAALLAWRVGADGVRRARRTIPAVAGVFWFGVWLAMAVVFWDRVYGHVFAGWARWVIPPVYGLGFAGVAAGWRWIALRTGRLAVPVFVALWGATGALTHAYAIFGRGLLEKPPMLQHLTPASAIVFATFEFGCYGCVILTASSILQGRLDRRIRPDRMPPQARRSPLGD
jgi:hypothetical protein